MSDDSDSFGNLPKTNQGISGFGGEADLVGKTVDDFLILRLLGEGGMGRVYLARQLSLKREVALKIIRKSAEGSMIAVKRFQTEAEAVARVSHPNIVQVYAVGERDGMHFMALEYVAGRNLREYLARKGPPELPIALSILKQVASALQRAGESGIVHRDIKPENILITRKLEVKVADFGLSQFHQEDVGANLTRSGVSVGSPAYMSPEQVQAKPVDHRSDIYSFGITAYHLLAGRPPFHGTSAYEIAHQHVAAAPEPLESIRPDLPRELCAIVHKMIAKRPEDRYASARDVGRELSKVAKSLQEAAGNGDPATPREPMNLTTAINKDKTAAITGMMDANDEPTGSLPIFIARSKPRFRVLGLLVPVLLVVIGWLLHLFTHTARAGSLVFESGLPLVRPAESLISLRERELRAKYEHAASKSPGEAIPAALDLSLLLIHEGRLDAAEEIFHELDHKRSERFGPKGFSNLPARLGLAIVLAHRDKAKESIDAFEQAIPKRDFLMERFLFQHPEFALAVAESLSRDAENIAPAKLSSRLERLRSPFGLLNE